MSNMRLNRNNKQKLPYAVVTIYVAIASCVVFIFVMVTDCKFSPYNLYRQ